MLSCVCTSEHSMTTLGLNVTVVFVSKIPFPLAPTTAMLPLLPRRWSLSNTTKYLLSLLAVLSLYLWAFNDDPWSNCCGVPRYRQGKLPLGPDHRHVAAVAAAAGHWATLVASRGRPALYTRQAPAVSASQPATSGRGSGGCGDCGTPTPCLQLSIALITLLGRQGWLWDYQTELENLLALLWGIWNTWASTTDNSLHSWKSLYRQRR